MLTYKKAGVDVGLADKLIEHIRKSAPAIGGFAGLFPLDVGGGGWSLVACTDGVGTKLKLAFDLNRHETVGVLSVINRGCDPERFGVPAASLVELEFKTWKPEDCPLCKTGDPVVKPGSRTAPK